MSEPTVQEQINQLGAKVELLAESSKKVPSVWKDPKGGQGAAQQDPREILEQRMAVATPKEAAEYIRIIGLWTELKQKEAREKTDNFLRRLRGIAKISMPYVGIGTGLLLLFTGFGLIGSVAVGAGLGLGPALLEKIMDRIPGGG